MEIEREEVRKKRSQSLSVPSPDLVGGDVSLQDQCVGQHQGAFIMETLWLNRIVGVTQGHI